MTHRHHTERDAGIESYRRKRVIRAAIRAAFMDAGKIALITFPLLWIAARILT